MNNNLNEKLTKKNNFRKYKYSTGIEFVVCSLLELIIIGHIFDLQNDTHTACFEVLEPSPE